MRRKFEPLGELCCDGSVGFSFFARRLHFHFKRVVVPPAGPPVILFSSLVLVLIKGRDGDAAFSTEERTGVPFGWFLRGWHTKLLEDFLGFRMFHSAERILGSASDGRLFMLVKTSQGARRSLCVLPLQVRDAARFGPRIHALNRLDDQLRGPTVFEL